MLSTFSLSNKTRGTLPRIPFRALKEAVLGTSYELSVALLPPQEAARITRESKHKDTPSNVLSFPLSPQSGEILLCPATAKKQARLFEYTPRVFIARLFIHGLLHLKGFSHGGTMDAEEQRVAKRFGF